MTRRYDDLRSAIESHIDSSGGPTACHPWTGSASSENYGRIKVHQVPYHQVHRVWYGLVVRPLLPSEVADHVCHDPDVCHLGDACPHRLCMNVLHIEPKSSGANVLRGNGPPALHARKPCCPTCGGEWRARADGSGRYCPRKRWHARGLP